MPYDRNDDGTWNYIDMSGWTEFMSFDSWLKDNNIIVSTKKSEEE